MTLKQTQSVFSPTTSIFGNLSLQSGIKSQINVEGKRKNKKKPRNNIFPKNQSLIFAPVQANSVEEVLRASSINSYIGMMSGVKVLQTHMKPEANNPYFQLLPQNSYLKIEGIEEEDQEREDEIDDQFLVLPNKLNEDTDRLLAKIITTESKQEQSSVSCMFCVPQNLAEEAHCSIIEEHVFEVSLKSAQERVYSLNFDVTYVQIEYDPVSDIPEIKLKAKGLEIILTNNSSHLLRYWYQKLTCLSERSLGRKLKLHNEMCNFAKSRYETQRFFAQHCETGDIILFQDDHFFAKAQRFFTGSQYDHVGLIIKDAIYNTLIFQSNSKSGVNLTPWSAVIKNKWYETIPKITWRRLKDIKRDKYFFTEVHKFVMANLRKSYNISLKKLFSQESVIMNMEPQAGQVAKQNQGYFCSELVAFAYKELGLLTRNKDLPHYKPACNFLPKNFTDKAKITLEKGSLSPEYEIVFDPDRLNEDYPPEPQPQQIQ